LIVRFFIFVLIVLSSILTAIAQEDLPHFNFDESKKMSDEELKDKREGTFVTGLPQLGSDPINGQGIGGDLFIYDNGKKDDPYFKYTPYRSLTEIHAFFTNKDQKEASIALDLPYVFDSTWRIRFEAGYEDNPNLLYFGRTAKTLNRLQYQGKKYSRYNSYANAIEQTRPGNTGEAAIVSDEFFNTYRKQESIINLSAENSYLDGTLRLLIGLESALINISTFDGKERDGHVQGQSLLQKERAEGSLRGLGNNLVNIAQAGIIYDTRDFEPDPTNGIFAELTDEYSSKAIGSSFNFNKIYLHSNFYKQIAPENFERLVFAARYGLSLTQGGAPFFEYQDSWGSEGSVEGLGGGQTLRGYKQSRFLAPLQSFINFETRWRFGSAKFWGQSFNFNLVPFFDMGKVWNKISEYDFKNYKTNQGIGLRVPWNQSTVLSFDYAYSVEDEQFFFTFGHIF
jgi:hypothetical protein